MRIGFEFVQWTEYCYGADFISPTALNRRLFNESDIDRMLQDLMDGGIKVNSGERLGKTIVFAQSIRHTRLIGDRFARLYPKEAARPEMPWPGEGFG